MIPAGPLGTPSRRHTPPYAIPSRASSKEAAWLLAQFLCAAQLVLEDARDNGFVEVARESVVTDLAFAECFRLDLLETVLATRPHARGERPVTRCGREVGNLIGDQIVRALTGEISVAEALRTARRDVEALDEFI